MKLAAAYVRCSTEMQEDSPDQQKKEIQQFADKQGYKVTEWYVDFGKSGTTFTERPEFQRLRKRVEAGSDLDAVICYDESRWGRAIDSEENTYWRVHFRQRGVKILLVKTSVDPENDFAPMLAAFESVQASQYSKKLSELTLRGAKNNGIYSNGGTAPYGYERIAVNEKTGGARALSAGEWSISGQEKVRWGLGKIGEIKTVQYIYERRAEGAACLTIARELNQKGVPCPKRGRWRNKDQKWSQITIKTIIENPSYYGARIYNRNSMSKIIAQRRARNMKHKFRYPHWRNDPSEWNIVEGAHEAIVSKDLWDKANMVNRRDRKTTTNQHCYRSKYLLSGLMRCSRCGFAFQGWSGKTNGKWYLRYIDGGWKNKGVCSHLALDKLTLENFAIQAIKEALSDPTLVQAIEAELCTLLENDPSDRQTEVERIKKQLVENEDKIRHLTEAIEKGSVHDSIFSRLGELEDEKKALELHLSKLTTVTKQRIDPHLISKEVARFILEFESKIQTVPPEDQKLLIKKVISSIIVDRERNVVQFYIRRIPAVSPQLEELLQNKKAPTESVSAGSSGGRT